jgi:hypothetical protein
MLGMPLLVTLTAPGGSAADPQCRSQVRPIDYSQSGTLDAAAQQAWGQQYLPVLLSKQPVQGIIWNQLRDSQPHVWPHGGLFNAQDQPKELLGLLESLRHAHLT